MKKEILYEINEIRVKMGLKTLEESSILLVEASPIVPFMEKFILRSGIRDTEKILIKKFLSPSVNGALTEIEKGELKTFLKTVEGTNFLRKLESAIANEQDDAIKLKMKGWLDNNLRRFADAPATQRAGRGSITGGASTTVGNAIAKVDTKTINNALKSFETTYPNLFQKKWYGSYFNQARIDGIREVMIRDFAGRDAKGIEEIIASKLADADYALSNVSKIPPETKSLLGRQISNLREYILKNPVKGTLGVTVIGGTLAYLTYGYIMEWYETGSPITAATALPFKVWGDIKSGWNRNKPYDNTPEGLLKYLTSKYGDDDYKNKYTLTPPNADGIIKITRKNGGGVKSFKHNGNTFIEQN